MIENGRFQIFSEKLGPFIESHFCQSSQLQLVFSVKYIYNRNICQSIKENELLGGSCGLIAGLRTPKERKSDLY